MNRLKINRVFHFYNNFSVNLIQELHARGISVRIHVCASSAICVHG